MPFIIAVLSFCIATGLFSKLGVTIIALSSSSIAGHNFEKKYSQEKQNMAPHQYQL